ncbi:RHS repeat-associated core domain-containing protein [Prevotella sp. E13-17]|uniref:RHS repeat domain-containing protein n=1 Tax=Prevotella sp. E13-17 TaxID=2913616 RepID=UPI001EDBDF0B|nr:RHS repeat-associated core domain-containing protein [Prevotella sp. E13-17]UKK50758.1 RHS repeat-associated core domain-containing protein [Prevotella sp. E13-17]
MKIKNNMMLYANPLIEMGIYDSLVYCGNFIYSNQSLEQVLFDGVYMTLDSLGLPHYHFYQHDHLGSVRAVVDENGKTEHLDEYYPFGATYVQESAPNNRRYKYNGKELDRMHGLNLLDYGARWYDPLLGRFTTMDPLCEKYFSISPYAYCANNPVNYVDPDGRKVYGDSISQENIRNTLTDEESKYVEFNADGLLDYDLLSQYSGTSANMEALKLLAKSDVVYSFESRAYDSEGKPFVETDNNFYRGVTEMPNAETHHSTDGKVHIITSSTLSKEQQAITLSHEGYGHGVIYERTRSPYAASHHYKNKRGESYMFNGIEYYDLIRYDSNEMLSNQIGKAVSETKRNIRHKKGKR